MKKLYHKKELAIEESPLTLQLHRRHTVVEGDKDSATVLSAAKLRPVSRSNSTSSIYRPPKSAKDLSSQKRYLQSTLSAGSSSASTVVITECELSSSWIYNNKKAQMGPKEILSAGESRSKQALDNEEGKSSIIKPKVKTVSSPNRRSRKCSSCCCYAAIVILAGLAVMGILSTIGGIVYMEFFSGSNETQTPISGQPEIGRHEDLSYTEKVARSLDVDRNLTFQDLMSEKETSDSSPDSKQKLEVFNHLKDSENYDIRKRQGTESANILRVKKVKKDVVPTTEADIPSSSIQMKNKQKQQGDSNKTQADFPTSSAKGDSPYSKLLELYKDIHTSLSKSFSSLEESSSFEEDKLNPKTTDLKAEISDLTENNTSELLNQHEIESDEHLRLLDVPLDSNDSSKESLKPALDVNLETSHALSGEVPQPAIPKYFFRRPSEDPDLAFKNMFGNNEGNDPDNPEVQSPVRKFLPLIPQLSDLNDDSTGNTSGKLSVNNKDEAFDQKESIRSELDSDLNANPIPSGEVSGPAISKNFFQVPSEEGGQAFRNMFEINERSDVDNSEKPSFPRFVPHIPELSDPNDATDDTVINLDVHNQESDLPFELNRPVSETKIAVPGPLDLIRRFTIGRGSDNKETSEAEQHDRRFSLAQALDRLRSLDVRNILPSSRKKTDSKKNSKLEFEPKVQNEQEVVTERTTYLQNLRRRLFE